MNLKRIAATAIATIAIAVGGATAAHADGGAHVYQAQPSNGCGGLRSVTLFKGETALWSFRTCEHDTEGKPVTQNGTYVAPLKASHKGCGRLLNLTVKPNGEGLFRYQKCDVAAR